MSDITKAEMDELEALTDRTYSLTPSEEQRCEELFQKLRAGLPGIEILEEYLCAAALKED